MQKAILKTLKDENGVYAFPRGSLKRVDLFCDNQPNILQSVLIDSSFTEFEAVLPGRIGAVKIVSACGDYVTYVLATIADVESLQSCCNDTINKVFSVGCSDVLPVQVLDIYGNVIGSANTPANYISIWNSNADNRLVGRLMPLDGWTFMLKANVGSFIPSKLACVGDLVTAWNFFSEDLTGDIAGYDYPLTQPLENGENISIPLTGMQQENYIIIRIPIVEPNFSTWYNTDLNSGQIPDFIFEVVVEGSFMYIKTRVRVTFETTQPLILIH